MIRDLIAEIYELKGEELAAEDAARAAHAKDWLDLDTVEKRVGKLLISRELLDKATKTSNVESSLLTVTLQRFTMPFLPQQEKFW